MKLRTITKLICSGRLTLLLRLIKLTNEFYRAVFVTRACTCGLYDAFINGKSDLDRICEKVGWSDNREALSAWLELGVRLGELKRIGSEYEIRGKLSRELIKPCNDACKALMEEMVNIHYTVIANTPGLKSGKKKFPFDESTGTIIARSSRITEPFIAEAVDAVIPLKGKFCLLEVGCGTGIYIKRACERNCDMTAVGLELQKEVAERARMNIDSWGLKSRVDICHADVRNFSSDMKFDLITLHQNIYYFPESDRIDLFQRLSKNLHPGGKLLLTSIGQGGGPGFQALNIWCNTTQGCGPLPYPDQLIKQFQTAGYSEVKKKRLIPFESLWAFSGTKPF